MTRLLVIDGSFLAYSRFRASGEVGEPFLSKLQQLQLNHCPVLTVVAWDTLSGSMGRRQLDPRYKADRLPKEPAYLELWEELRERLTRQDVLQAESPSGEADDVIATLVRETPGHRVIYSGDKDFLQLCVPGVTLIKAAVNSRDQDRRIDGETIVKEQIKFGGKWLSGLDAHGWGDLLAIAGDRVDGVPGIKGVGAVRAHRLLLACPWFVDAVLAGHANRAHAAVVAADVSLNKVAVRCIDAPEELRISRALVELRTLDDIERW
jgi:5'-3' exonuclease